MMDMKPNLILAGVTRAGTTSLHHYLGQHPEIYLPRKKELHFFNVDENFQNSNFFVRHLGRYNGESVFGDFTPLYMCKGLLYESVSGRAYFSAEDSAVRRIARTIPDTKIIITLRHPYYRYISQFVKNYAQGKFGDNIEVKTINDMKMLRSGSIDKDNFLYFNQYDIHLAEVLENFPTDNVSVSIFEEWTENPYEYCREIFRFLKVDENILVDAHLVQNSAKVYRNSIGSRLRGLTKLFQRRSDVIGLSPATSKQLAQEFEAQVTYVESVLNRPIPAWRSLSEALLAE